MAVQTKILHRRDTAANWTSTNPTLSAGELGFETDTLKFKIGNGSTAWTSLTYSQDASLLSGAASLTTLTTTGSVTIGGDLTVNGTTTSINSSTVQVDDKNIELASVTAVTGRVGTAVSGVPSITISTAGLIVGMTVTRTAGATMNTGTIVSIGTGNITVSNAPSSSGSITLDFGGATDVTADGAGFTVLGATSKTFNWVNATAAWTSSEDLNLLTGKVYEINGSTVLSSTQVLGYGIASTNTASNVVARDASGNFAAGTITASLTGTASLATSLAGGATGGLHYQTAVNTSAFLAATATNNQVLSYNTATGAPQWTAITGTGSVVYSTNPVLTTPNIGTPSFANLTSATGYKVDNLANTGTSVIGALQTAVGTAGAVVVNGGALGTPSSGTLTNATGLPIANVANLGTGVATFLTTPNSSNLLGAVTDETGTGNLVFSTSPTLVTPILGVASATTINKVTFTAPATAATLTLANGSTLQTIGAFFINATATANTDITFPTSGTLASQTYVGSATVAQANNLTGATANLVPYQSAANTTSFIAAPAGSNYVLTASATGAPAWAAPQASVTAGNGINVSSGTVSINTAYATTWTTTQRINVSSDVLGLAVRANATSGTANLIQAFAGDGTTTLMSLSNVGTLFAVTIDGGSA